MSWQMMMGMIAGRGALDPPVNHKTLDGFATGGFTTASGTVTLTTVNAGDVILLSVHTLNVGAAFAVTSVTSASLTWTRRTTKSWTDTGGAGIFNNLDIWWAPASAALSAEVITVTLAGVNTATALIAYGVSGSPNNASPWDTNVSVPGFAANPDNNSAAVITVAGITTNSSVPTAIYAFGTVATAGVPTIPAGFTSIASMTQGGFRSAHSQDAYKNSSSALSGASFSSGSGNGGMIIDALA
jgi:hypothetical protein